MVIQILTEKQQLQRRETILSFFRSCAFLFLTFSVVWFLFVVFLVSVCGNWS